MLIDNNVIGNIHLYNLFLPLILKGKVKKVVCLSTGMADIELARNFDIALLSLYSASKAAMNVVTAKFSAQYRKDGVLFLGISPGFVDVGKADLEKSTTNHLLLRIFPVFFMAKTHIDVANRPPVVTPHQIAIVQDLTAKYKVYAPHYERPATPGEAIPAVIRVWENASIEKGDGGAFLSHLGNKQWL
jgi:NAD(P)-dependent dehydrogenase (short-subunit alcohol dehydrogenase family)